MFSELETTLEEIDSYVFSSDALRSRHGLQTFNKYLSRWNWESALLCHRANNLSKYTHKTALSEVDPGDLACLDPYILLQCDRSDTVGDYYKIYGSLVEHRSTSGFYTHFVEAY